ncbi:hypothetical protein [Metamycoplasma neophronis]|uniref:Lipoprotein n=1 Tax=Metamycoplasma neophronis TaxID=872983 RepID=A0ABY2Z0W0_9BACT|nr:hypothetical protein [Metamycoplasma neophronis]TPR54332.1 hypothetical protein FJR74_00960 [Metamycoplasma neophronis]
MKKNKKILFTIASIVTISPIAIAAVSCQKASTENEKVQENKEVEKNTDTKENKEVDGNKETTENKLFYQQSEFLNLNEKSFKTLLNTFKQHKQEFIDLIDEKYANSDDTPLEVTKFQDILNILDQINTNEMEESADRVAYGHGTSLTKSSFIQKFNDFVNQLGK